MLYEIVGRMLGDFALSIVILQSSGSKRNAMSAPDGMIVIRAMMACMVAVTQLTVTRAGG